MDVPYKVGVVLPPHPLSPATTRKILPALTPCGNVSAMTTTAAIWLLVGTVALTGFVLGFHLGGMYHGPRRKQ